MQATRKLVATVRAAVLGTMGLGVAAYMSIVVVLGHRFGETSRDWESRKANGKARSPMNTQEDGTYKLGWAPTYVDENQGNS